MHIKHEFNLLTGSKFKTSSYKIIYIKYSYDDNIVDPLILSAQLIIIVVSYVFFVYYDISFIKIIIIKSKINRDMDGGEACISPIIAHRRSFLIYFSWQNKKHEVLWSFKPTKQELMMQCICQATCSLDLLTKKTSPTGLS